METILYLIDLRDGTYYFEDESFGDEWKSGRYQFLASSRDDIMRKRVNGIEDLAESKDRATNFCFLYMSKFGTQYATICNPLKMAELADYDDDNVEAVFDIRDLKKIN